jgi:hypothetical protein
VFILDCWMERKHEGHGSMRMLTSPNSILDDGTK